MSLQGAHDTFNDPDDQDQLSKEHSVGAVETYSHEQPEPFSQDPDDSSSWPPQCATPQSRVSQPRPPYFQAQIRPEPQEWSSSSRPNSTVSRNQIIRTISSAHNCARSSSSSTHSRQANSRSSTSDAFRHTNVKNASGAMTTGTPPAVLKVSKQHRRISLRGFQHDGKPSRPSSRPSMPPAAFWRYAAEKKAGRASFRRLQSAQIDIEGTEREPSMFRYPIFATRPEAATTLNKRVHHSNNRAVRRPSYENIRKGICEIDIYNDDSLCPDPGDGWGWAGADRRLQMEVQNRHVSLRRQSKRLVKKRQPWEAEPRCKSRTASKSLPNETKVLQYAH